MSSDLDRASRQRTLSRDKKVLGRHLSLPFDIDVEIVGVVKDISQRGFGRQNIPEVFIPAKRITGTKLCLVVKTSGSPSKYIDAVRKTVWNMDKSQPISQLQPVSAEILAGLADRRMLASLLAVFGLLALLLTATGVAGVMTNSVAQTTKDLAVRFALGARRSEILKMILLQSLWPSFVGMAVGTACAWVAADYLRSLLFEIQPHDWQSFGFACLSVFGLSSLACCWPARSVITLEPLASLRYD